jgi:hypothetical protein
MTGMWTLLFGVLIKLVSFFFCNKKILIQSVPFIKYLNSGAGGIGGAFVHNRHFNLDNKKKLDGWWSHRLDTRFQMNNSLVC